MDGPERYEPDSTPGVTCIEDLPKPKIMRKLRSIMDEVYQLSDRCCPPRRPWAN